MARVGHSAMTADELTENIEAAVKAVAGKIRMVSVAWGVFLPSHGFRVDSKKQQSVWNLCKLFYLLLFNFAVLAAAKPS